MIGSCRLGLFVATSVDCCRQLCLHSARAHVKLPEGQCASAISHKERGML